MKRGNVVRDAALAIVALSAISGLSACDGESGAAAPAPAPLLPASIGGGVTGLAGGALSLSLNSAETLTVPVNGAFTFATQQAPGANWSVAIARAPMAQNCSLANGSGVAQGQPVIGVAVTCGLRSWRATESFGAPAGEFQQHPLVAIDGQGTAFIVSKELTGPLSYAGRLQVAERSAAGAWTAVGTSHLDASTGGNGNFVFGYDLAAAGNGRAFAAWGEVQPTDSTYVMVSRRLGTGQWSAPARLDTDQSPAQLVTPKVAVSADETAIAVWSGYDLQGQGVSVYASRFQPASGWGAAVKLESLPGAVQEPGVAMDAHGNATVVWVKGGGGPDDQIWATSYRPGTGWASAVQLDNGTPARGQRPRIAMDENGAAIAVWERYNLDTQRGSVVGARFTLAGGWNTAVATLLPESGGGLSDAHVVMNPAGHAFVAMDHLSIPGFNPTTWIVRFTPSGGWEAPVSLATGVWYSQVGIDPEGNATVVYVEGAPSSFTARRYLAAAPGAGWLPAEGHVDGLASGDAQDPRIAVGPDGRAMVVFSQLTSTSPVSRTPRAVRLD